MSMHSRISLLLLAVVWSAGSARNAPAQTKLLRLPDRILELLHYLGMYKLAGLSMPGTPAATP